MSKQRTSSGVELLLPLRRGDRRSLARQIEQGLRDAIRGGRLSAGQPLPSTRSLASQLNVSRGVVVEAYGQLVAECYLDAQPGGITRVAQEAMGSEQATHPSVAGPVYEIDFRPGQPDLASFPRAEWLRSVRRVLADAPADRFGYLDGAGLPELREVLATYLNRARGTAGDASTTVIASGFAQSINLLSAVLRAAGARVIALEDPGDPEYRAMIQRSGLRTVGIPVDAAGIRVDLLEDAEADAVLVTPAHQYPTGGVLPPERRAALVSWANRRRGWIVEDDYDAEFRYDRQPIGAIHGLAPERVVYAGSASKVLAPGLRLGWLLVPSPLVGPMAAAKRSSDMGSSALDQLAFADFLGRGELDRHLRRMRPIYRRRRDALLGALARHLPDLRPVGASAGLHLLAWLPPGLSEAAILEAAEGSGIGLSGVSQRWIGTGGAQGLVFGYGLITESAVDTGIRRLASIVDELRVAAA